SYRLPHPRQEKSVLIKITQESLIDINKTVGALLSVRRRFCRSFYFHKIGCGSPWTIFTGNK
ncbi:MAG: hypothetical protein ACOCNG_01435, partial [Bacteroidales bacterium]